MFIREKIRKQLSSTGTGLSLNTGILESASKSDGYLNCFTSVPTKDTPPLISTFLLDMINSSLITGYIPPLFKVVIIKPPLKKPTLDPEVLANC